VKRALSNEIPATPFNIHAQATRYIS